MKCEHIYEGERIEGLSVVGESWEDRVYLDCTFTDCCFSEAEFRRVTMRDCKMIRCRLENLHGRESSMQRMEFDGCFFSGIQWHEFLSGNRYAELLSALANVSMRYCTFSQMKFPRFDFSGTRFVESMFAECDLSAASFRGTALDRTEFFRCDLTNADFRDAAGYRVDVPTCRVKGARFSFPEAVSLLGSLGIKVD